jgi:hypothetical protein
VERFFFVAINCLQKLGYNELAPHNQVHTKQARTGKKAPLSSFRAILVVRNRSGRVPDHNFAH